MVKVVKLPPSDISALQRQTRSREFMHFSVLDERLVKMGINPDEMQIGELRQLSGDVQVFRRVSAFQGDFPVLARVLKQIRRNVKDLSPLFQVMSNHFFRTNMKLIFSQYSAGTTPFFAPLRLSTLQHKPANTPILVHSGSLMLSLTGNKGPAEPEKAINLITPRSLRVGTKVPYAEVHQTGYLDVPPRPPVQIGVGNRLRTWVRWAKDYTVKLNEKE